MDRHRVSVVDAFTDEPLAGNAAGVVAEAAGLSDGQMQAVARELAVSETAFVLPAEDGGDRRVRFFSPTREVDLCGHATVASHAHLLADGAIEPGDHRVETAAGTVDVTVADDGVVWLDVGSPDVETVDLDLDRVGEALSIPPAALRDVGADLPAAVVDVGIRVLVVPVNFLEHLGAADPDDDAVEGLTDAVDAAGLYAFTFDALDAASTLHARFFAPGFGIPEDPVTGTASAACGAYLRAVDAFDSLPDELRFEQGHFVDRPGIVRVRVDDTVAVGGRAVTAVEGTVVVPPTDDDDIIEV